MNSKKVVFAMMSTVIKVVLAVVVIMFVYRGAVVAYDYGYRLFNEPGVTEEPGRDVTVEITEGMGTMDVGNLLENKGLIRDARLFYVQNLLSHYKDTLLPGTYVLNTSWTPQEMMEMMGTAPEESEEESGTNDGTVDDSTPEGTDETTDGTGN